MPELQDTFSGLKQGIERIKQLDATQKNEALQAIDEKIQEIMAMRKEGQAFAGTVRPLVPRMKALLHNKSGRR